jgi:hypothetical protein
MDEPISEAVQTVLDYMRDNHGDAVIPDGVASLMFCGVEDSKISDLSDFQLMQVAICQYRQRMVELEATMEMLVAMKDTVPRPNRFTRRHH